MFAFMRLPSSGRQRPLIILVPLLCIFVAGPSLAAPQAASSDLDRAAAGWDEVFGRLAIPEVGPETSFAARCAERLLRERGLQPGNTALVLAMGDGRNALYLAGLGLKVTGVDISSVGLEKARKAAADRDLEIETVRADLFQHDFGVESWDLVTNVYFNPSIRIFDRLKAAVRPAGFLLVEGFGAAYKGPGPAQETRYQPNQLLAELSEWRILEYQDGIFPTAWAGGRSVPVVRILAQKPR